MIETLSSQTVYENRWMRLREDKIRRSNGSEGIYAYLEKAHAAVVIPFDGERVTLVRQYRHTIKRRVWEFPMGAVESGDLAPEDVARQELREETGLAAGRMTRLGSLYFAYGMSSQPFDVFLAEGLESGSDAREAEEFDLEARAFPVEDLDGLIESGEIVDSATVAALYLWRSKR